MKKLLTFLVMAMIVSVAAYAENFTKAAREVSQNGVTAEVIDPRGGSNQAAYVEFTNRTGQFVEVDFIVYYDGKKVDRKTVRFTGKTHKEVFNSIASMFDQKKEKPFLVSISVNYIGRPR